ncbi:response regulator transcription factor [Nocardioides aquiterrae]|uniref:response regulator n=1 Tax=Nocardioides aquiterrae TaxID=203799 RepID=UPI0031D9169A
MRNTRRIRVVAADDDATVRAAVRDVLEADGRFEVVGLAGSGYELLALTNRHEPDLVLVDLRMEGGGVDGVRAVATLPGPRTLPAVVALSAQTAPSVVVETLRAGAVGYLAKGRSGSGLPDVLARIAAGDVVIAVPSASTVLAHLLITRTAESAAD